LNHTPGAPEDARLWSSACRQIAPTKIHKNLSLHGSSLASLFRDWTEIFLLAKIQGGSEPPILLPNYTDSAGEAQPSWQWHGSGPAAFVCLFGLTGAGDLTVDLKATFS
jgi:hypothetical protein